MVRGFFVGLCAAFGFFVGLSLLSWGSLLIGSKALSAAFEKPVHDGGAQTVIVRLGPSEKYEDCIANNYGGEAFTDNSVDVKLAVQSCMNALADWKKSPDFATEWASLINRNQQVRYVIQTYNKK